MHVNMLMKLTRVAQEFYCMFYCRRPHICNKTYNKTVVCFIVCFIAVVRTPLEKKCLKILETKTYD